jgi:hypothetical protein
LIFKLRVWGVIPAVAICMVLSVAPGCRRKTEKNAPPKVVDEHVKQTFEALSSAWASVEAFSVDMASNAKRDVADRAESKGKGGYRFQKKDGRDHIHYFVSGVVTFWLGEDRYAAGERVQYATDGVVLNKLTLQPDHRELLRTPYSPEKILLLGGDYVYNRLLDAYQLEVTGEEVRDGRDVVVIKATAPESDGWIVYQFDKATGIIMAQFEYDADGATVFKMENSNLNLSPEYTDEDFTFITPEEITIIDETGAERIVIPYTPEEVDVVEDQSDRKDVQPDQPDEE